MNAVGLLTGSALQDMDCYWLDSDMFRKCCLNSKYAQLAAKEEAESGGRILPPVKIHLPTYAYSSFPTNPN